MILYNLYEDSDKTDYVKICLIDTVNHNEYQLRIVDETIFVDVNDFMFEGKSALNIWWQLRSLSHSTNSKKVWGMGLDIIRKKLNLKIPLEYNLDDFI